MQQVLLLHVVKHKNQMNKGYLKLDTILQTLLTYLSQTSLKSFQSLLPWIVSRT